MAIPVSALRAIHLAARLYGVDFKRTVMLGRQQVKFSEAELSAIIRKPLARSGDVGDGKYGEGLFRLLGAELVDSIDASDYEGASIIMDFNLPLRPELRGIYSFYCDLGSMEHIFNVPQVIRNTTDLLADDGHALVYTICNGFPNHGFYQFTPEFFYATFSPRNGFRRTAVFLVDLDRHDHWSYVRNPSHTGVRTRMSGFGTLGVVCIAQKACHPSSFLVQQSDYEYDTWQAKSSSSGITGKRRRRHSLLKPVFRRIRQVRRRLGERMGLRNLSPDLIRIDVERISRDDFWRLAGDIPVPQRSTRRS